MEASDEVILPSSVNQVGLREDRSFMIQKSHSRGLSRQDVQMASCSMEGAQGDRQRLCEGLRKLGPPIGGGMIGNWIKNRGKS